MCVDFEVFAIGMNRALSVCANADKWQLQVTVCDGFMARVCNIQDQKLSPMQRMRWANAPFLNSQAFESEIHWNRWYWGHWTDSHIQYFAYRLAPNFWTLLELHPGWAFGRDLLRAVQGEARPNAGTGRRGLRAVVWLRKIPSPSIPPIHDGLLVLNIHYMMNIYIYSTSIWLIIFQYPLYNEYFMHI